jgi:hypothetical protein
MEPLDIDTNYTRVIPRDLFNEAKLSKCMGRLCLLVHDHMTPVDITIDESKCEDGFIIGQLTEDGSLTIVNLPVKIKNIPVVFKCAYNAKQDPFPLLAYYNYCEYKVFDEKGEWHEEFLCFCKELPDTRLIETTQVDKPTLKEVWSQDEFRLIELALKKFFNIQPNVIFNNEVQKPPTKWLSIQITYGLAFTSSSEFAAYWVCNGDLLYNDLYKVKGFGIGDDYLIYGIAKDNEENFIYFRLDTQLH